MKKWCLLFFFLFCLFLSKSQQVLKGRLLAADTKQPVASASVFLSNTGVGVVSNNDGTFQINSFPNGRYDLVVSILGYETYIIELQSVKLPPFLEIFLKPKAVDLQEIILEPYDKNGWDKWGSFFIENLIGKTPNSFDCELKNKEVVKFRFSKKENVLKAYADEPLIIENKALGYFLKYSLTGFEYNFRTRIFYYQGYPFFTEFESNRNARNKRWQRNRFDTYKGSLMHFMRAVYRNRIKQEGFEVRKIIRQEKTNVNPFVESKSADFLIDQLLPGDSIAFQVDSVTAGMWFSDYLQVMYPTKKMPDYYTRTQRNMLPNTPMTAELWMPNKESRIIISANGGYQYGKDLLVLAFWAWSEKLSNMLPLEYKPPLNN
jgi:hypothetical protein